MEYVVKIFEEEVSVPIIIGFAKLAIILPVTKACPKQGASAVKNIKRSQKNSIKKKHLNALLRIPMDGPGANSPEARQLINNVIMSWKDILTSTPYKVPQIYAPKQIKNAISTQTEVMDIDKEKDDFTTYMDRMEE